MSLRRAAIVFGILLVCGLSQADATRPKIAVLGVESRDTTTTRQKSASLAKTLTTELRARAESSGFDLAPGGNKDLIELKLLSDCIDESPGCMATLGKQLSTDVLVYGHLEKQRAGYAVSLFRLDVATATVKPIDAPRLGAATDAAVKKLAAAVSFGPTANVQTVEPPRIVIKTNVPATIYVNGMARGSTGDNEPLTVNDVSGGTTRLAVEAPGKKRWESSIDVLPHGATDVSVNLDPVVVTAPPIAIPPAPVAQAERPGKTARVLFWTSLVATGAGVAAFTITGLQVRSIEKEQDAAIAEWGNGFKSNGVQFPNDACAEARHDGYAKLIDICDRGQNMATVSNVLIGVTAAAAVATAIFYWRGYLATSEPTEAVRTAKLTPMISPEIYKNGGGLSTVIQF